MERKCNRDVTSSTACSALFISCSYRLRIFFQSNKKKHLRSVAIRGVGIISIFLMRNEYKCFFYATQTFDSFLAFGVYCHETIEWMGQLQRSGSVSPGRQKHREVLSTSMETGKWHHGDLLWDRCLGTGESLRADPSIFLMISPTVGRRMTLSSCWIVFVCFSSFIELLFHVRSMIQIRWYG